MVGNNRERIPMIITAVLMAANGINESLFDYCQSRSCFSFSIVCQWPMMTNGINLYMHRHTQTHTHIYIYIHIIVYSLMQWKLIMNGIYGNWLPMKISLNQRLPFAGTEYHSNELPCVLMDCCDPAATGLCGFFRKHFVYIQQYCCV